MRDAAPFGHAMKDDHCSCIAAAFDVVVAVSVIAVCRLHLHEAQSTTADVENKDRGSVWEMDWNQLDYECPRQPFHDTTEVLSSHRLLSASD